MTNPDCEDLVKLADLRSANVARQKEWDAGNQLTLAYRGNELAGEVGEACNVIKKLERERLGIKGSRDTVAHLAEELADVVICADLIAMHEGIDLLGEAVPAKFNATSEKVGLKTRLAASDSGVKGEPEPVAWPANLNPRTLDLVQRFALALAKKLRLAEEKYGHTDGWWRDDWEAECRDHLYQHLEKGDPRDVAAYCAFMWHHGWITYRPVITAPPPDAGMREALEPFARIADLYSDRDDDDLRIFADFDLDAIKLLTVGACRKARAALTAPGATKPIYICYDGYGDYYINRERPLHYVAVAYDEDIAEELAAFFNRDTPTAPGATTKSDGGERDR